MTYRPAIGPGRGLPVQDTPTVTCDGCGVVKRAIKANGVAPRWLLDGKAPPGWWMQRTGPEVVDERRDLCPRCKP